MKMLSRPEELILLSVLRLDQVAYCVPIFEEVQRMTGMEWSLGSIYPPLYRLEERGLLSSALGEPTAERGGKRKRFYQVTEAGREALRETRAMNASAWEGMADVL